MEQFFSVYEYRMNGTAFRFEAGSEHEAQLTRDIAILHFRDLQGSGFDEHALEGPIRIPAVPHRDERAA